MNLTPDQLARIEQLAQTRDPFWLGAQWVIDHLQPPETPGASSFPEETP